MVRNHANILNSRTYQRGEATVDEAVVGPTEEDQDEFRVGEDEDSEQVEYAKHNSEESRQWDQAREADIVQQPQYGVTGEEFENVWGDGEGSGTAGP